LEDGDLDSPQQAELEDIATELTSLLTGSRDMYEEYLDTGMEQETVDKMVKTFQERIERVGEIQARINQLTGPQEV